MTLSGPLLSRSRLTEILDGVSGRRVAVVGDAMLDVYLRGDVDRISPEAPVPVVRVRETKYALGGAANVAQNVVASGATGILVAVTGSDTAGERLRMMLRAIGSGDEFLLASDRPTTTKTRLIARSQQMVRFDEEEDSDLDSGAIDRLCASLDAVMGESDALVLEDYNKGVLVPMVIDRAIALARRRGVPVIVDPKYRNFFAYRGATVFKPNRRELESALGAAVRLEDSGTLPATLARLGAEHLLLTLGERGMALVSTDGSVHQIPTAAREVYDVVGAGDTVTAYLAAALAAGATALEAAVVANLAAGVEVGKLGAATVSPAEIIEAWEHFGAGAAGNG